jgi:ATP-dependent Lon protease
MEVEIQVPNEVPVMTLPNVAFFPQALLPLRIFEMRYRRMLTDVLCGNRIFAVAGVDGEAAAAGVFEPPHRVACIGLVRACQKDDDGTSRVILQGLCRVAIESIVGDEPYRRIRIRALASSPGAAPDENAKLQSELSRLIRLRLKLSPGEEEGAASMLSAVKDPEIFADIAAFNLCKNAALKQKLLETLDVNRRLALLLSILRSEVNSAVLQLKLRGYLPDGRVSMN